VAILETQFIVYVTDDKQASGQPDGQAQYIDRRIELLSGQISYRRIDMISKHAFSPSPSCYSASAGLVRIPGGSESSIEAWALEMELLPDVLRHDMSVKEVNGPLAVLGVGW
jgi:hypothetical protein